MSAVDAVIVAYRSEGSIASCVAAAQRLGGDVVVVDHSDGASAAIADRVGARTVVDTTNPGFGAGQNRGVAMTTSPYVLLCNPDAEIDDAAVRVGVAFLDDHLDVAAVQGVIVNASTGQPERSQGCELGPAHLLGRALGLRRLMRVGAVGKVARRVDLLRDHVDRVPAEPTEVETLAATALLVRRAAFNEVGGFDESYFMYGEDLDLARRLRARSWRLVTLPQLFAAHVSGASAATSLGRELSWWRGTVTFAARWWTPGQWRRARTAAWIRFAGLALAHPDRTFEVYRAVVLAGVRERRRCDYVAGRRITTPSPQSG